MTLKNNNFKSYQKLIVYQKSKELVLQIYQLTKSYPKEEVYVMVPQMRRASLSVAANIVEGYVKSTKEFIRFINISIGSATEVALFLELSKDLKYISESTFNKIDSLLVEVLKLLYSYQKSLRSKEQQR